MQGLLISGFGFLLIMTPSIMALLDGVQEEDDIVRWLMGQPIEKIIALKALIDSGAGLLIVGALIYYLPS